MEVAARMMVFKEARECVEKINANMTNVRTLVLDLYEREGWSALGYPSWRECVVAEFKNSQVYLYRQLEAAQTAKVISPIGEKEIPEAQLRPLTKLKDNPEQQREAWTKAVETAPDGKITAAHVAKVVGVGREQGFVPVSLALTGQVSGHRVSGLDTPRAGRTDPVIGSASDRFLKVKLLILFD